MSFFQFSTHPNGHAWSCMGMYGHVWSFMGLYGLVRLYESYCTAPHCLVGPYSALDSFVWLWRVLKGLIWSYMVKSCVILYGFYGLMMSCMFFCGPVFTCKVMHGHLSSLQWYMVLYCLVWSSMVMLGHVRSRVVLYCPCKDNLGMPLSLMYIRQSLS